MIQRTSYASHRVYSVVGPCSFTLDLLQPTTWLTLGSTSQSGPASTLLRMDGELTLRMITAEAGEP